MAARELRAMGLLQAFAAAMTLSMSAAGPAQAQDAPSRCDRLAASPFDRTLPPGIAGVAPDAIDHAAAIVACAQAVKDEPGSARRWFQYGRALAAAGRDAEAYDAYREGDRLGSILASNNLAVLVDNGFGGRAGDPAAAFPLYLKAARGGLSVAMNNVGLILRDGRGTAANKAHALGWFRNAVQAGFVAANWPLAELLGSADNPGGPDHAAAARHWRALVASGDGEARIELARRIVDGTIDPASGDEVRAMLGEAASTGSFAATMLLSQAHEKGRGATLDPAEARRLAYEAYDRAVAATTGEASWPGDEREAARRILALVGTGGGRDASETAMLQRDFPADMRRIDVETVCEGEKTARAIYAWNWGRTQSPMLDQFSFYRDVRDCAFEQSVIDRYEQLHAVARQGNIGFLSVLTAYDRETEHQRKLQAGDPEALLAAAKRHHRGEGAPKDFAKAIDYYRQAALKRNAEAARTLGDLLFDGDGVKQDKAAAHYFYMIGARAGDPHSQWRAGKAFSTGEGAKQDHAAAFEWFSKAAAQNHLKARYDFATSYRDGRGVKADAAGFRTLLLALGHELVISREAVRAAVGIHYPLIINLLAEEDPAAQKAAFEIARRLEMLGPEIRYVLGLALLSGRGTTQDTSTGVSKIAAAAASGFAPAKHVASVICKNIPSDPSTFCRLTAESPSGETLSKLAVRWIANARNLTAAEGGNGEAAFAVATDYERNGYAAEADRWLDKALSLGSQRALTHVRQKLAEADETELMGVSGIRRNAALSEMGSRRLTGRDGPVDHQAALDFFEQAGDEAGIARARQGLTLLRGTSVEQYAHAKALEKQADEANKASAKPTNCVAVAFWFAAFCPPGEVGDSAGLSFLRQAFFWLEQAAQKGHLDAQYDLSRYHKDGKGTVADPSKRRQWLERAASAGQVKAQTELAGLLMSGKPTEANKRDAVVWYSRAAEKGDNDAATEAGKILLQSDDRLRRQEGERLLRLAAARGYAIAKLELGMAYFYGGRLPLDIKTSGEMLLAARASYLFGAAPYLGVLYMRDELSGTNRRDLAMKEFATATDAQIVAVLRKLTLYLAVKGPYSSAALWTGLAAELESDKGVKASLAASATNLLARAVTSERIDEQLKAALIRAPREWATEIREIRSKQPPADDCDDYDWYDDYC